MKSGRDTVAFSLPLLLSGSETYSAAGAAEFSLQRNDQVSDAAQQRGAGMVSHADLVDQLSSQPTEIVHHPTEENGLVLQSTNKRKGRKPQTTSNNLI